MLWLALVCVLGSEPYLRGVLTIRDPDGSWRCSGWCHVDGNRDGGKCREPAFAKSQPSEEACKAELERQCKEAKSPPGGCHVGREGRP